MSFVKGIGCFRFAYTFVDFAVTYMTTELRSKE